MKTTKNVVKMGLQMKQNGEVVANAVTNEIKIEKQKAWRLRMLDNEISKKVCLENGLEFGYTKNSDQVLYHPELGYYHVVTSSLANEINLFKIRFIEGAIRSAFEAGVISIMDDKYLQFDGNLLVSQKLLNDNGVNYAFKALSTEAREEISKKEDTLYKSAVLNCNYFEEIFDIVADHISAYDLLYLYKESTESYLTWIKQRQERKAQ
ncbi:hypothetical protein EXW34_31265 (plasmid) [Bacillus mycoides]|uniref:hypothetical protein n=1 Tax=Bacillus mycoides TaxID=1405 RepID=UPI001C02FA7D|nr:hypothetical protein [Bacillus mycoides]QWI25652.1 hypothetical protein EXW34_31265 [Bacillus mycoides]